MDEHPAENGDEHADDRLEDSRCGGYNGLLWRQMERKTRIFVQPRLKSGKSERCLACLGEGQTETITARTYQKAKMAVRMRMVYPQTLPWPILANRKRTGEKRMGVRHG